MMHRGWTVWKSLNGSHLCPEWCWLPFTWAALESHSHLPRVRCFSAHAHCCLFKMCECRDCMALPLSVNSCLLDYFRSHPFNGLSFCFSFETLLSAGIRAHGHVCWSSLWTEMWEKKISSKSICFNQGFWEEWVLTEESSVRLTGDEQEVIGCQSPMWPHVRSNVMACLIYKSLI